MRMILLISLLLFSNLLMAQYPENVEELLNNNEKLDQIILKTKEIASKDIKPIDKEKLNQLNLNLNDLKFHSFNLMKSNSLDEAIKLSSFSEWSEVTDVLIIIKKSCSDIEVMEKECFIKISDFLSFIQSQKIIEENKKQLSELVNNYLLFNQSKIIINDKFINSTSALLTETNELIKILHKPFAVIKMIPIVPTDNIPEKVEPEILKNENIILLSSFKLYFILGFFLLTIITIYGMKKIKTKRIIRFYTKIYFTSKKNQLKARLFGRIKLTNFKRLKTIEDSYCKLLNISQLMKKNLDVRIKNIDKNLIIETQFHSSKAIEEFLNEDSYLELTKEFESIEKIINSFGGELLLSNSFDNNGKLTKSSFTVVI